MVRAAEHQVGVVKNTPVASATVEGDEEIIKRIGTQSLSLDALERPKKYAGVWQKQKSPLFVSVNTGVACHQSSRRSGRPGAAYCCIVVYNIAAGVTDIKGRSARLRLFSCGSSYIAP